MKLSEFCESFGTQGGSLLLLTVILISLYPLLMRNDEEAWKAFTFILGGILGIINGHINSKPTSSGSVSVDGTKAS